MTDDKPSKKPHVKVGVIGHAGGRSRLGIAAAMLLSTGAALPSHSSGKDLSKDPRYTPKPDPIDKMSESYHEKNFPMPTSRKGGLKKHIQATRPRWRQPK